MGLNSLSGLSGLSGLIGVNYLLRDEFVTDRAAGAVNGTAADPGPGTRVVTDTGNNAPISTGRLRTTNAVGAGDPGLWYASFTRIAGRALTGLVNEDGRLWFGYDSNQAGVPVDLALQFNATSLLAVDGGGGGVNVATITQSNDYRVALVHRTAGGYFFINSASSWVMLWQGGVGNTSPLFPAFGISAVGNKINSLDYIRIPDILWLPTPLAYDTFTRADGALGSTGTAGPDGQATTARAWNNRVGTTLVVSNAASASVLSGGIAIATIDTNTADVLCDTALTVVGGNGGIVVRYTDSNNYVIAYHDTVNAHLDKVVAGVTTPIINAAAAYAAGRVMRVICDGTEFRLYYNNAQIGATSTIADAALQNGTEQGLYSTNVGNSQDDFQSFARGTNGEYSNLDTF